MDAQYNTLGQALNNADKKTTNEREVANTAKAGIGDNLDVNGYDGFALSH